MPQETILEKIKEKLQTDSTISNILLDDILDTPKIYGLTIECSFEKLSVYLYTLITERLSSLSDEYKCSFLINLVNTDEKKE